jgi:hypothetical protein
VTEVQAALFMAAWAIAMSLLTLAFLSLVAYGGETGLDACERCQTPTNNGRYCRNCAPTQE